MIKTCDEWFRPETCKVALGTNSKTYKRAIISFRAGPLRSNTYHPHHLIAYPSAAPEPDPLPSVPSLWDN
jgi:hypothetical protein